jgi:hypothetical protein
MLGTPVGSPAQAVRQFTGDNDPGRSEKWQGEFLVIGDPSVTITMARGFRGRAIHPERFSCGSFVF